MASSVPTAAERRRQGPPLSLLQQASAGQGVAALLPLLAGK